MKLASFAFALVVVALFACKRQGAHPLPSYGTPDGSAPQAASLGQGMYAATCENELAPCYAQANASCPNGYDVVSTNEPGPNKKEMIVRCKDADGGASTPAPSASTH